MEPSSAYGPAGDLEALLRRFRETQSDDSRNELLFTCSPMVEYFLVRAGDELRSLDADAFATAGYEALLGAFADYDLASEQSFVEFAWQRVAEAMSAFARRHAGAPPVVRAQRGRTRAVSA